MAWEDPWFRNAGSGPPFEYLSPQRDVSYLEKAYGKMVWATATGVTSHWGPNTLDLPTANPTTPITVEEYEDEYVDEIDPATGNKQRKAKVKSSTSFTPKGLYGGRSDGRFLPKPHLVSISTSGIDEYGTTFKGSYTYRVYGGAPSPGPPAIGSSAGMSWGWSYAGKGVGGGASFSGKVLGYNINSNTEGGFDITVDLLGSMNSVSTTAISVGMAVDSLATTGKPDAQGNAQVINGVFSAFGAAVAEAASQKTSGPATFASGLTGVIIEVPEDYASTKTQPAATTDTSNPQYKAYVTFQSVVDHVGKLITKFTGLNLKFADEGRCPGTLPALHSGDPLKVLVPGAGDYGDKSFPTVGSFDGNSAALLLSCEALSKIGGFTITEAKRTDGASEARLSIKSFFDNVFRLINDNVGNAWSLTLANSGDRTDPDIYIADFNRHDDVNPTGTTPYRSATLSAALDSDQATIFYTKVQAQNSNMPKKPTGPGVPQYDAAVAAVGASADPTNTAALNEANRNAAADALAGATDYKTAAPWTMSVTLDGVGGWKYGGVITNPVAGPASLPGGAKVYFVIKNVSHSVSAGDWTVSLDTYARIV